jgi:uncharacterized protein YndB with AHSA1/START domain
VSAVSPVRKQIHVAASQAHAFAVFTGNMSRWWPATHSILKSPLRECIVEPRAGGRWYSLGEDGSSCQIGFVIAWLPPDSLTLAWQINADWQYDPELVTEVEVHFIAESERVTRVELEHRNLQRMGERAGQMRSSVDSPGGWSAILQSFKSCAEQS